MDNTEDKIRKNKTIEKELLEKFQRILISKYGYNNNEILLALKNSSKIMDCTIKNSAQSTIIGLEAKCFFSTDSNSDYFLSLFGKIIKGRALTNVLAKNEKFVFCEYGFLLRETDKNIFVNYVKKLNKNDWINFCKIFDLKYIYLCGEEDISIIGAIEITNQ